MTFSLSMPKETDGEVWASVDGSSPVESLALPKHFADAPVLRAVIGPSVQDVIGATTVAIDNVVMYWGAE